MRMVSAVLCLAVSGMGYAGSLFDNPGKVKYQGEWKHKESSSNDKWASEATVEKVSDSPKTIKVSEKIRISSGGQVMEESVELVIVETAPAGFFDVKIADAVVGSGYCYTVQCHYSYTVAKPEIGAETTEETLSFVNGKIYKLGSSTGGQGTVAWQGVGEHSAE